MKFKKSFLVSLVGVLLISGQEVSASDEIVARPASSILPAAVTQSPHYQISPTVTSNGRHDIFVITSQYGSYVAEGRHALARRISEINAMVALDEVQKDKEFAQAVIDAGTAPFEAAWDLVTDPVDTVGGAVKGIGTTLSRLGGLITKDRSELEDARYKELLGVSALKRQYANELGVDVYSSNELLQEKLNKVAWVSFSGNLATRVAMALPENDKVRVPLTVGSAVKNLNKTILDSTPEDLRSMNEDKLKAMKVPNDLIDELLAHDWYSPRHQTAIVMALETMKGVRNRSEFIRQAVTASSENSAFHYQHMAEMLAEYNASSANLVSFFSTGRLVMAEDNQGHAVVVVPYDHVHATYQASGSLTRIDNVIGARNPNLKKRAIFIGKISPNMQSTLENSGWDVTALNRFAF